MEKTDEKVCILIVDDDENICKSLALILRKKGYTVETAGTGHEALEKAQEGFFNVALLDIKLPDMEGIELIGPLKELHPDIDMFMITAYASLETAVEALNRGATAYFLKPPDMDEVLVLVKDALEKQRLVRENRMLLKAVQKELAERKQAEEALIKAHDELELRVVERTNELAEANVKLQDDITERKRTEEALRESEEQLREAQALGRIGNWEYDPKTQAIKWSDQTFVLYERDPAMGPPTAEEEAAYYSPEQCETLREFGRRAIDKGKGFEYDLQVKLPSGRNVDFSATMRPVKDDHGRIIKLFGTVQDITERKRAEVALSTSEEKYRLLSENAIDGFYILGPNGFEYVNPAFEQTSGYKAEEMLREGFDWMELVHPDDKPLIVERVKKREKGEELSPTYEFRLIHKDGKVRFVEVNTVLLPGEPWRVFGIYRDITERKRAEEALKDSEAKHRNILESIEEGYFEVDLAGNLTFFNDSLCLMVGFSRSELTGMNNREYTSPETAKKMYEAFNEMHRTGKSLKLTDYEVIRADGNTRVLEMSASLMRDPSGEPIGFRGIIRDMTERKRAEEALRESEGKYRSLVESTDDAVYLISRDMRYEFANSKYLSRLGLSLAELVGQEYGKLHPWDANKEFEKKVDQVIKSGKPMTYEYLSQRDNKYFMRTLSPVTGEKPVAIKAITVTSKDITERKRAEEALSESEEKYRLLVNNIPDVAWITDCEGNTTFISEDVEQVYGYTPEEIYHGGSSLWFDQIHPDDLGKVRDAYRSLFGGKGGFDVEYRIKRKDGAWIWLHDRALKRYGAEEDAYAYGVFSDITERKRVEEELRDSKELFEKTFNSQLDAIFILNAEIPPKIREWNAAAVDMFGYENQEMSGRTTAFLHVDETMLNKFQELLNPAIEENGFFNLPEFKMKRKNGTVFPTEHSVVPVKDDQGKSVGWVSIVRDITERKQAEEALWSSQGYSQNIVDSSLDMIIAVDNRRIITAFNAAALKTFGYESEEVLGKHVNLLYADPKEGLRVHKETVKYDHHIQEILNRRKNGELFPCLISASVLRDADGNRVGVMGVSRDITERKQAEDKLSHYASELERSNRELQQFAYAVSHDLQEPLRTIRSYLQLLADRYRQQLDADADTFITFAVEGADRMRELIRGLLTYSQVEAQAQDFKPTNCEEVLESTLANLQVTIKETQAQVTHDPLPTVMADGPQMGQLIQNLIENAIKFRKEEPPCVHISAREERDHWLFSVRDNGMGIDPEQTEHIFEIFRRLAPRNEYPGTGIGLTICRKIVERHGGRIWVESVPGEGSTFSFTIAK